MLRSSLPILLSVTTFQYTKSSIKPGPNLPLSSSLAPSFSFPFAFNSSSSSSHNITFPNLTMSRVPITRWAHSAALVDEVIQIRHRRFCRRFARDRCLYIRHRTGFLDEYCAALGHPEWPHFHEFESFAESLEAVRLPFIRLRNLI